MTGMQLINLYALPIGVVLIGLLSGGITWAFPIPKSPRLRWWLLYGTPCVLAFLLLFSPIRGLSNDSPNEPTCGWDVILIGIWAAPGVVASTLVLSYKERRPK